MRRPRRALAIVGGIATIIAISGSVAAVTTGRVPAIGALTFGSGREEWDSCKPGLNEAVVGMPLGYPAKGPITLLSLRAVDAVDVEVVDAVVVPVTPELGTGFQAFPPTSSIAQGAWQRRVPIAGATIQPREYRDLAIHLRRTPGALARVDDFELRYRQGWRTFTVTLDLSVSFSDPCTEEDE